MAPGVTAWLTGRTLHAGFMADEPAPETTGALFEPVDDGCKVDGGWRARKEAGGAALAAATHLAALPIDWMELSYRMADVQLTATFRMLQSALPGARLGPESK